MKAPVLLAIVTLILISFSSCDKPINDGCYSSELEDDHSGFCTMDCPGVCGCDGNTYCNECMASKAGILEVTLCPCQ